MNCKKTNKNILTAILALALILVCAASIVSCNNESDDTMFPEYTGDIWTLFPSDDDTDDGHLELDSNDNIIDAGLFTIPVSDEETLDASSDSADGEVNSDASDNESDAETTAHVIGDYDGVHNWPSDEFDESGYKPLNPVTKPVID